MYRIKTQTMSKNWYWTTQVQEVMSTLVRNGFTEVMDVCYHNDQCPSVLVGQYLIFLPNSDNHNPSNEEYNGYVMILDEEYAFDHTYEFGSRSLSKIITELKKLNQNFVV